MESGIKSFRGGAKGFSCFFMLFFFLSVNVQQFSTINCQSVMKFISVFF